MNKLKLKTWFQYLLFVLELVGAFLLYGWLYGIRDAVSMMLLILIFVFVGAYLTTKYDIQFKRRQDGE